MRKDLKKLASLISISLSTSVSLTAETLDESVTDSSDENMINASVLNQNISIHLAAHRSHSSHSSHSSHRSSSGATYRAPRASAPVYPAATPPQKPPSFQKSNPLGQQVKPPGSIPKSTNKQEKKAKDDAKKRAEYHRKWKENQEKKKADTVNNSVVEKRKSSNAKKKTNEKRRIYIIKRLQLALSFKGYDVGEVNGVMGSKTISSIKKYKQKIGLKSKHHIDKELLNSLGIIGY
jgi:His-Xaa-Ser repeat protein HxsA